MPLQDTTCNAWVTRQGSALKESGQYLLAQLYCCDQIQHCHDAHP